MAKFSGIIGFVSTSETSPGVWEEISVERCYKGNILENFRRWEPNQDSINDDIIYSQKVRIIADQYAISNKHNIKYIIVDGVKWKITNITIDRPGIIISTGGVYNG